MKGAALLLLLLRGLALAHVGSPNVFFSGRAGVHPVTVAVRPPPTLPGIAHVDVRVESGEVSRVTMRAVFSGAGAEGPRATEAVRSPGDSQIFTSELWLLRSGAFSVDVAVESGTNVDVVKVPLDSAAIARPAMPAGLQLVLVALGATLFAGGIVIVCSIARDASLAAGVLPSSRELTWARRAAVVATFVLCGSVAAGAFRWRAMDRDFRMSALAQPVAVNASVHTNGDVNVLRLVRHPVGKHGSWEALATDHGKLMHLFLVREGDQNVFAHLHPVRRDAETFEAVLPPLPPAVYDVYGELTYADGAAETVVSKVAVLASRAIPEQPPVEMANEVWCQSGVVLQGNAAEPLSLDPDDSWHMSPRLGNQSQTASLIDGSRMVFASSRDFDADQETTLRFKVLTSGGDAVPLQPYMGMLGHAAIRRVDGQVFTHLHPLGTISMAAQEILAGTRSPGFEPDPNSTTVLPAAASEEVTFPYAFPLPGKYRMWVQVRVDGRVQTGVFDVDVKPKG